MTPFGRFVQLLMTRADLGPKDVMRRSAMAVSTIERLMSERTVTSTATVRTLARGLDTPADDLIVLLRPYTPTDPAHVRARFDLLVGDLTMDEMRDAVEASTVLTDERKKLLLDDIDTIDWENWIR
ncbi:helix-turn-helix domain-containing protein [Virgisporangium aliadipatigenens]|uniref:helix-turn-helix domain-containing protein n=1 Tax=Virgisporangium aliadipatigenens TaxID=741659 RepID=UPI0019426F11|nr:helix-turn-helix transcriptional regulator [Virgisporangium aliadipatigenens]